MKKVLLILTSQKIKYSYFLLALFSVSFLFHKAISAYFFQDDWFSFSISQAKNIFDILAFFKPRSDLIYYRPLGMQIPFFITQTLFGITPWPFKLAALLIHLLNGWLVYSLLNRLLADKQLSFFGALLYVTSVTHYTIFYWAATFAFVLAPTFYLSSFLFFLIMYRLKTK